jgi:anti-anti-sigma factor
VKEVGAIPAGELSVVTYPTSIGLRLAVSGEIDIATVDRLTAELDAALARRVPTLVIDLIGVTFMASAGVTALLNAYRQATAAGIPLVVTNCGGAVERILEITGVFKLLTGLEPGNNP